MAYEDISSTTPYIFFRIPKLMNLFKPTFGDTQSYGIIKDFSNALVVGLKYLDKVLAKHRTNEIDGVSSLVASKNTGGLQGMSNVFHNAVDVFGEAMQEDSSMDAFSM